MKQILPLALPLILAACSDNGTVLGSHTNGGAGGTTAGSGTTLPGSGGSSTGGVAGNPNPGSAGTPAGSVGGIGSGGSTGSSGSSATGGTSGAAGGAGTAGSAGTAGAAGAPNDECGGCTPPYQVCIYQVGGPGPSRFLCAEQQACGSAGLCDCIVGQGGCVVVLDDAGTSGSCSCDNGLE